MQDVTFHSVAGSGAVDETDFMSAWEEVQDAKVITFLNKFAQLIFRLR